LSTPNASARSPLIAVILSLAATGLGQIYCGRIVRGLVMFLGSLLFAPAIVVAALLPPATIVLVGLILALLTVLGVYVFAVVDAFRLARRGRDLFQSMDYNHPLVYALFILVGLTYSAGGVYFIRSNVFEAFAIPMASEIPTLLPGDRFLVNKTTYQRRFVRRGDEVVFRVPSEGANWVKRVIALPGDTVEVKENEVFVNGQQLAREPTPRASLTLASSACQDRTYVCCVHGVIFSPLPSRIDLRPAGHLRTGSDEFVPATHCRVRRDPSKRIPPGARSTAPPCHSRRGRRSGPRRCRPAARRFA